MSIYREDKTIKKCFQFEKSTFDVYRNAAGKVSIDSIRTTHA